jgi:hypothetical protein
MPDGLLLLFFQTIIARYTCTPLAAPRPLKPKT